MVINTTPVLDSGGPEMYGLSVYVRLRAPAACWRWRESWRCVVGDHGEGVARAV